jgi:peptidoglycan/LPS O-acetylase OafA/YrhL
MFAWRIGAFHLLAADAISTKLWGIEQLPGRIDQFLAGMLACHLARMHHGMGALLRVSVLRHRWIHGVLLAVGPVTLVALAYRLHVDAMYVRYWEGNLWLYVWHLYAGIAVAVTLYALAIRTVRPVDDGKPVTRPWWKRALVSFGVVSYSFYLWHALVLERLPPAILSLAGGQSATPKAFAISVSLGLVVALAVSGISYLLFERPFERTRAKLRTS